MTAPYENKPGVRTPIFWIGWVLMIASGGAMGGLIALETKDTDPSSHYYGWMAGVVAVFVLSEVLTRAGRRKG
ncbi:MAG: hypothetical protein ACAH88_06925 [Roseimicrobium sp.]